MAAFASERMMAKAVPVESGHAEAGAGGDHSAVAFGVFRAFAQSDEVFGVESVDAVGVGFEIVEQAD